MQMQIINYNEFIFLFIYIQLASEYLSNSEPTKSYRQRVGSQFCLCHFKVSHGEPGVEVGLVTCWADLKPTSFIYFSAYWFYAICTNYAYIYISSSRLITH